MATKKITEIQSTDQVNASASVLITQPVTIEGEQVETVRRSTLTALINALCLAGVGGSLMTEEFKQALLNCINHSAWTDEHGQDYVDALEAAMYPLSLITAVYTQSGTVYDTDPLDSLKTDLIVTAVYESGTTETVPEANYTLSGTLTAGTSTITVSYGGKTATFDVTVSTAVLYELATPFASDGSNSVDTGIALTDNAVTTLLCEATITSFASAIEMIYSNRAAQETQYSALQTQLASSKRYVWGSGLGWAAGANFVANGNTIRFVYILWRESDSWASKWAAKNVTSGVSKDGTGSAAAAYVNSNTVHLGAYGDCGGFAGTVNKFMLLSRALSDDEISNFLANGA